MEHRYSGFYGEHKGGDPRFELDSARLDAVLEQFVGRIEQVPPMMSALKQGGVRLQSSRSGCSVERQPRTVTIYSLKRFFHACAAPRAELQ